MSGIVGGAGSKSGVVGQTEIDYEVGTYEPVITASTSGSFTASTNKTLQYTKIGRICRIQGRITADGGTLVGTMYLSLPFTSATLIQESDQLCGGVFMRGGGVLHQNNMSIIMGPGTKFYISYLPDSYAGSSENVGSWNGLTNGWNMWIGFSYIVA